MEECAACGKQLRRGAYSWTMGWSLTEGAGRGIDRGEGKQAFDVRFHNTPNCINIMTQRMDGYAWEKGMAQALDGLGIDFGYGDDLVEYEEA